MILRPCYGPFFLRAQNKGTVTWAQVIPRLTLRPKTRTFNSAGQATSSNSATYFHDSCRIMCYCRIMCFCKLVKSALPCGSRCARPGGTLHSFVSEATVRILSRARAHIYWSSNKNAQRAALPAACQATFGNAAAAMRVYNSRHASIYDDENLK